jgi:hypothetical protein
MQVSYLFLRHIYQRNSKSTNPGDTICVAHSTLNLCNYISERNRKRSNLGDKLKTFLQYRHIRVFPFIHVTENLPNQVIILLNFLPK